LFQPETGRIGGSHGTVTERTVGRITAERLKYSRIGFTAAQLQTRGNMQIDQMTAMRVSRTPPEAVRFEQYQHARIFG
jgi:hypothetical protein